MDERIKKLIRNYVDRPDPQEQLLKVDPKIVENAINSATNIGGIQNVTYNPELRAIAQKYMQSIGKEVSHAQPVTLNPSLSKNIANTYESMKHNPDNPEVKAAYDALKKETLDQYKQLKEAGYNFEEIKPGAENPYKTSKDMARDVSKNKHLYYYPTEQGFGTQQKILNNPLLESTGEKLGDKELVANDIFRIVHDVMGHAKEGSSFGPLGEENAWAEHMKMYSPEAQKALTTETRGQNSWVNYGPKGEYNRLNPANTIYADQKVGLLPDFATKPNTNYKQQPVSMDDLQKFNAIQKLLNNN